MLTDDAQQVSQGKVVVHQLARWLRDEEANAGRAGVADESLTELPWRVSVKSVQQDVQ